MPIIFTELPERDKRGVRLFSVKDSNTLPKEYKRLDDFYIYEITEIINYAMDNHLTVKILPQKGKGNANEN
jgi:hypothetical protein